MKRSLSLLLAAAALAVAPLTASAHPVMGSDGVLRFPFADKIAPAIFCKPLFICDIILEPGESVLNVAIGDSARWVVSPATSGTGATTAHILIKPTEVSLSTNLVITTSKRAYFVDLHSADVPPMSRVGFFVPKGEDAANSDPHHEMHAHGDGPDPAAGHPSHPSDGLATPADSLDFAYHISGDRAFYPAAVYNDGVHTYVRLDPHVQTLPVLFAVGPDGDQLVNYRVKDGDNMYLVDAVPDQFALVAGSGRHQHRTVIARSARKS